MSLFVKDVIIGIGASPVSVFFSQLFIACVSKMQICVFEARLTSDSITADWIRLVQKCDALPPAFMVSFVGLCKLSALLSVHVSDCERMKEGRRCARGRGAQIETLILHGNQSPSLAR